MPKDQRYMQAGRQLISSTTLGIKFLNYMIPLKRQMNTLEMLLICSSWAWISYSWFLNQEAMASGNCLKRRCSIVMVQKCECIPSSMSTEISISILHLQFWDTTRKLGSIWRLLMEIGSTRLICQRSSEEITGQSSTSQTSKKNIRIQSTLAALQASPSTFWSSTPIWPSSVTGRLSWKEPYNSMTSKSSLLSISTRRLSKEECTAVQMTFTARMYTASVKLSKGRLSNSLYRNEQDSLTPNCFSCLSKADKSRIGLKYAINAKSSPIIWLITFLNNSKVN